MIIWCTCEKWAYNAFKKIQLQLQMLTPFTFMQMTPFHSSPRHPLEDGQLGAEVVPEEHRPHENTGGQGTQVPLQQTIRYN